MASFQNDVLLEIEKRRQFHMVDNLILGSTPRLEGCLAGFNCKNLITRTKSN